MERMSEGKESGTLLGVGTAYLQVKEIKGEFYIKVSDFTRCMDGIRIEQEADRKHIEQLEEENKKLKDKIEHLEFDIEAWKKLQIEIGGLMGERDGLKMVVEKLHNELDECECSMHFENDEVGYRKRECKKLKEEVKYYKEKSEFLNKVIVKYQEELSAYDREYYDEDKKANKIYKKQYEHSMGEDDELIYEEGLYD